MFQTGVAAYLLLIFLLGEDAIHHLHQHIRIYRILALFAEGFDFHFGHRHLPAEQLQLQLSYFQRGLEHPYFFLVGEPPLQYSLDQHERMRLILLRLLYCFCSFDLVGELLQRHRVDASEQPLNELLGGFVHLLLLFNHLKITKSADSNVDWSSHGYEQHTVEPVVSHVVECRDALELC